MANGVSQTRKSEHTNLFDLVLRVAREAEPNLHRPAARHHRKAVSKAVKECGNVGRGGGRTLANLMTDRVIRIEPMIKHTATVRTHGKTRHTHDTEWCISNATRAARRCERSVQGP